jgi:hypothetical protein
LQQITYVESVLKKQPEEKIMSSPSTRFPHPFKDGGGIIDANNPQIPFLICVLIRVPNITPLIIVIRISLQIIEMVLQIRKLGRTSMDKGNQKSLLMLPFLNACAEMFFFRANEYS